jgi:hypothetical protein
MKIKVISSWNNRLYNEYAHRFEKTYNWPFDLVVYNEDKDMFDKIPDLKKFIERNKNKSFDSYRHDAVRFSYKVYAYTHAILNEESDGLICIDADSVFYKNIDDNWLKKHNIHKDECMMSYLGRGTNYSECGFLYFNMKHKDTKDYAKFVKDMYDTDRIYTLKESHDSWVWDYCRKKFEEERGTLNNNIGDDKTGHVQARSILGTIYDHTKGKRKIKGRSPEAKI